MSCSDRKFGVVPDWTCGLWIVPSSPSSFSCPLPRPSPGVSCSSPELRQCGLYWFWVPLICTPLFWTSILDVSTSFWCSSSRIGASSISKDECSSPILELGPITCPLTFADSEFWQGVPAVVARTSWMIAGTWHIQVMSSAQTRSSLLLSSVRTVISLLIWFHIFLNWSSVAALEPKENQKFQRKHFPDTLDLTGIFLCGPCFISVLQQVHTISRIAVQKNPTKSKK